MVHNIEGIKFEQNENSNLFIIENFSKELKEKIQNQLSAICHGLSDGESKRIAYNYQNTLKEFFKRYKDKTENQQKGMIGELLAHVVFLSYFENFDTVSPFFNSEERNVKKGFDLILYNTENSEIWITEVKSGHLHKDKNANETTNDLLGTAKRDLNTRLNESNQALWINAITGAKKSLENYSDKKQLVKNILEDIQDNVVNEQAVSLDKNVVLVSNIFHDLTDLIQISTAENFSSKLTTENIFNNHLIVCIQKETLENITTFLERELKNV